MDIGNFIFSQRYKPGDLLTMMDAQEAYKLRTIGVNWHQFLDSVKRAYEETMKTEGGFGPVRVMLVMTRSVSKDNVLNTVAVQMEIPVEMLQWPK